MTLHDKWYTIENLMKVLTNMIPKYNALEYALLGLGDLKDDFFAPYEELNGNSFCSLSLLDEKYINSVLE